ncbi:MAG: O-antigen ligase family protein [Burkholderiales bacterium]|nr:O-antigen ligase family protein [Burkholderiales bacterium]
MTNLKALLVVLVMAMAVFIIAKPLCLRFMSGADYLRRRNVWLALTTTAFISPSFWIYVAVALPLMYWAAGQDENPVALYVLLLHVIPPVSMELPAVFVNKFFDLSNYRILAFAVLIPTAWRLMHAKDKTALGRHKGIDRYLWAYLVLQLIFLMPYEDITNTARRGFLFFLDCIVLVYVVSRICNTKHKLAEVLAVFCLACAIMVPLAVFESQKVWVLYRGLPDAWGIETEVYLFRDGALRAQVSTGHSLALGFILSVAFALWLYVANREPKPYKRIAGMSGYWLGLFAAMSRAPWIGAVLGYVVYTLLGPKGVKSLVKVALIAVPVAALVLISPVGPKVIEKLPFVGTVDSFNVEYRERLAQSSWELIQKNPLFGDPFFTRNLEQLRQGQGIIDLVNVYASIAMLYGIVGLFLFVMPFLLAMWSSWKQQRRAIPQDDDMARMGASLLAAMLATAFFMATGSFYGVLPKVFYLLVGLGSAYGNLQQSISDRTSGGNKRQ